MVYNCSKKLTSLKAAHPQVDDVLTLWLTQCGTVPEKEQGILSLCSEKAQTLCFARVTKKIEKSEELNYASGEFTA